MIIDDMMEYKNSLEKAIEYGKKICMEFETALKPIIPDIKVHLGGIDVGINCISFDSDSHMYETENSIFLENIVRDMFPEIDANTDFGLYLSGDEIGMVREALKKLRMGNMSELLPYCDEQMARSISRNISQDAIMELIEILKFIEKKYPEYGKPSLVAKYYVDDEIIAYILIIIPLCNWEEWKDVERVVLEKENLLKGRVAVTCVKGLTEG
jgi:hypothetical protein